MKDSITSLLDVFSVVISRLETNHIEYMVVGSVASIVYGEPRMTKDMDLVIDIMPIQLKEFECLFPEEEFYCPPLEVLSDELVRRGQFNLIHQHSGLKIDFVFRKNTAHGQEEFKRKRKMELWPSFQAQIASPEDVIIKKLDYYREGGSIKHLLDIKGILAQTETDLAYLEMWIQKLNLRTEWDAAKKV
ncbi:MAG: nucleotidyl transferase AbiEii/AbiGii toxin family protein [Deltaproteobacteria bacterium]|nr:nucleotidyl transferase AbiEii/AbiGii toxin family protein [Deltaproteobacteria bacterium]